MSRHSWKEHAAGPYTARVYRGRALSALLIGLASITAFIEEQA